MHCFVNDIIYTSFTYYKQTFFLIQDNTGGGPVYKTEGEESVEGRSEHKTESPADNTRRWSKRVRA